MSASGTRIGKLLTKKPDVDAVRNYEKSMRSSSTPSSPLCTPLTHEHGLKSTNAEV